MNTIWMIMKKDQDLSLPMDRITLFKNVATRKVCTDGNTFTLRKNGGYMLSHLGGRSFPVDRLAGQQMKISLFNKILKSCNLASNQFFTSFPGQSLLLSTTILNDNNVDLIPSNHTYIHTDSIIGCELS